MTRRGHLPTGSAVAGGGCQLCQPAAAPVAKLLIAIIIVLLWLVIPAYGHRYNTYCRSGNCWMHSHDTMHNRGYQHDSRGNWYNPKEQNKSVTPPIAEKDEAFAPTPQPIVDAMLKLANLQPTDKVYELGCGAKAPFALTAAKQYGCQAVGIEIDEQLAKQAQRNSQVVGAKVRIVQGDCREAPLDDADVVCLYLYDDLIRELPNIFKARCVVSYSHQIPGVPQKRYLVGGEPVYCWVNPFFRLRVTKDPCVGCAPGRASASTRHAGTQPLSSTE
jgi:hypothetical protein